MSKIHLVKCRYIKGTNTQYTFATTAPNLKAGDIVTSSRGGRMEVVEYTDVLPPQRLVALSHVYTKVSLLVPHPDILEQFQKEKHRDDEIAALRKQVAVLQERLLQKWGDYS